MRIGIDIRYLSHNLVGGVHTYVQHLVPALLNCAPSDQFFLYADEKSDLEINNIPSNAVARILPYRNRFSSIKNDLKILRNWMTADQVDIAHFPTNYGFGPQNAKTVITLHDEINIMPWREIIRGHSKNLKTVVMMAYLHFCSIAAMRQADLILTVSEYSRQQIIRYASHYNPQQIVAVHSAIDPQFKPVIEEHQLQLVRKKYKITLPFILADAFKNPAVIVHAWQRLPDELRQNHQIVFFARRPEVLPIVSKAVQQGIATLLINPPREDLIRLFSQAKIFVFPSWLEGFGLPLLEAMACGAPVIASDRGSIPEVAGDSAMIIDADDAAGLANHIERLLTSNEEAAGLRQRGYRRAAQFSWKQNAQKVLEIYQSIIE